MRFGIVKTAVVGFAALMNCQVVSTGDCIVYDGTCDSLVTLALIDPVQTNGSGATSAASCPTGYVEVPFNTAVGTSANFCIAKYEMKCAADATGAACSGDPLSQAAHQPWVSITQNNARSACSSLGSGYHLVTNEEWMTVARDVESVGTNWDGGVVNTNGLNRGNSNSAGKFAASTDTDPCFGVAATCSDVTWDILRRTHVLSNGEVVWDMSGNVHDFIDWFVLSGRASNGGATTWAEINGITPTASMPAISYSPLNTGLTAAANNIGRYQKGTDGTKGAAFRGASKAEVGNAGIFALEMDFDATQPSANVGFRCAYTL